MIKKIIAVLLIVFITVAATIIFYWKDSQFDPSSSDLLIYLLILPVLISTMILTPWLIYRFYQARQEQRNQPISEQVSESSHAAKVATEWLTLQLYAAFSKSALGENDDIIQAIQDYQSPQLDMKLVNSYGLPILSYRIAELDVYLDQEDQQTSSFSVRQQRVMLLIQQQIEQQSPFLQHIVDHLRRSSLFFETEHLHEYRMHPAWIDPQAEYDTDEPTNTAQLDPVSRLNRLNLHIILSEDLLHLWDDASCSEYIYQVLGELGFLPQKIHVEYHFWGQQSAAREWSSLLQNLAQQQEQITLIIHADSEIDQDLVDERTWLTDQYIAAEYAGSCCLAGLEVKVENLSPIKQIRLALNQPKIAHILNELDLTQLQQYQSEQPFVVVAEHATDLKVLKQLAQQFEETPIETQHYLYISSSLGNTQQLSKIYAYMLAMQFPDDQTIFITSTSTAIGTAVIQAIPSSEPVSEVLAS
ncbi:hypothetical protein KTH71_04685 [Acinetobacter sp. WU_MDCI_Axc73]|nr:hypothetical protein [Acinetobacter sp. WU_MDCI_Axc73]